MGTIPDAAVESASVSAARKVCAVAVLAALAWAVAPAAEAQPPIRIGATLSRTGVYAVIGQNLLRGYQFCVKHMNEKGGVLGRKLELVHYDDRSDPATAVGLYEKLIMQDKVDLVLGPYSGPITDAVANVTEKHKMPMVAPTAGATSIYRKGRKFIFGMNPPTEVNLEGLIDMAAKKGLKTVALINVDDLFGRATTQGAIELAKKRGLQVVLVDAYPEGTTDFSAILTKVRAANPDVLGGAARFEDAVAITRQMKALNVNPRMYGQTAGADPPKFYEVVGRDAEFVYGATPWVPELVELRAGGLIPIARQYPGAREFVESHRKEFPGAEISSLSAAGYGGCQILVEATRRAGSLDSEKLREAILKMDHNTVFGGFRVDRNGAQIGHKRVMFQWQDGKKVIVWPEELAPGQPRFPTPPWSQRP
ncbi:MAG TPA: amino acid ABC transporter substrate-binding protein [Methylomirabilota bacterium]|jgi:branched-chain amino acid transport system substrate-binding protein|nr:amino acid ABC transporter substrate-binding protein [Methylomirabilota bacterium]